MATAAAQTQPQQQLHHQALPAAPPADARDPRLQVSQYLERHGVADVMQGLLADVLFHKPSDPVPFVVARLERARAAAARPLLDAGDLGAMYSMLDPTRSGAVTAPQARAALATALGAARAAAAVERAAAGAGAGRASVTGAATTASSAAASAARLLLPEPGASSARAAAAAARRLSKREFVDAVGAALIAATPNCTLATLAASDDDGGSDNGGDGDDGEA